MRLNKAIALQYHCSRRQADEWIKRGIVSLNGTPIADFSYEVQDDDRLGVKGKSPGKAAHKVYWMLNKPDKILCSRVSQGEKMTLFELPALAKIAFKIEPVGRLDYRSEGLLILTNDGDFAQILSHPRFQVQKHYQVLSTKKLTTEELAEIKKGFNSEKHKTQFPACSVRFLSSYNLGKSRGYWYNLSIRSGQKRVVRNIFAHFDARVVKLVRFGIGPLRLDEGLKPGEYRALSSSEIHQLKDLVNDEVSPRNLQSPKSLVKGSTHEISHH
jgi:23S rRNA pseudouridine2605 synthase